MRIETLVREVAGKKERRIKLDMSMAEWRNLYRHMCSSEVHLPSYRQMGRVDDVVKIMFDRNVQDGIWYKYEKELRVYSK